MKINLKMYISTFKIGIRNNSEYRFNIITTCLMNFFPIVVNFFLWNAIYLSKGAKVDNSSNLTLHQIITYIIMVQIVSIIVETSNIDNKVLYEIRQGELAKYIVKPVNYYLYNLTLCLSKLFIYILPITLLSIIMRIIFNDYFVLINPKDMFLFFILLINALIIRYTLGFISGLLGFFIEDIGHLFIIFSTILDLLSGFMFPLVLLPSPLFLIFKVLPFYFIGYFPCTVLIGIEKGTSDIIQGIIFSFGWTILLIIFSAYIWRRGLKKYSTYGG